MLSVTPAAYDVVIAKAVLDFPIATCRLEALFNIVTCMKST
jgi:hypothetical protein